MIKIMIVDDVPVFRDYLKNFIDWEEYGFEVCCEAKDGKEALEFYEQYQPEIVLTDIVMPYMDGLELAQRLLLENPKLSIVLITGNSEFEYAKKAVKLGVCDYIVKPFEKEELIITLLKLQDNINKMLEQRTNKEIALKRQETNKLQKYIYQSNTDEKAFPFPYFLVITVSVNLYGGNVDTEMLYNWKQVILSMLSNQIEIEGQISVFQDYEGNIVTILNFATAEEMKQYRGYEFEDIAKLAKDHIGIHITVGISDYCVQTKNLRKAYLETIEMLGNGLQEHTGNIYDYKKIVHGSKNVFYSKDLIDEIYRALAVLQYDKIQELILSELDRIREYENKSNAFMIYMSLLSLLFSYYVKKGSNLDDIFGSNFQPYNQLLQEESYQKRRAFVCNCYKLAIDYQKKHQDTKTHKVALHARTFIEQNYKNSELSIADISKALLVNQTYLRRMFKEEYNMTISDYITKYRMETAKKLIESSGHKLSSVASDVGYNDTSYFSKCFKKYFGFSPSSVINTQKF